jgi:hypothetical protein
LEASADEKVCKYVCVADNDYAGAAIAAIICAKPTTAAAAKIRSTVTSRS